MVEAGGLRHGVFDVAHLIHAPPKPLCDLLVGRLSPEVCRELVEGAPGLPHLLARVHRNADGATLVGHAPSDCLPDPPGSVGGEAEATLRIEFLDCPHQPYVALLDQILEGKAHPPVFLGHRDNQPEVVLYQLLAGTVVSGTCLPGEGYLLLGTQQPVTPDPGHVAGEELWSLRFLPLRLADLIGLVAFGDGGSHENITYLSRSSPSSSSSGASCSLGSSSRQAKSSSPPATRFKRARSKPKSLLICIPYHRSKGASDAAISRSTPSG